MTLKNAIPGQILAFDYGTQYIGVACGQAQGQTAVRVAIIRAHDGIPHWPNIEALLDKWRPERLVVGLPFLMDGQESEMTKHARKFGNRLHGRFGYPVDWVDERLSSEQAQQLLGLSDHQARDQRLDDTSAVIILRRYWQQNSQRQ